MPLGAMNSSPICYKPGRHTPAALVRKFVSLPQESLDP
jgi:hypothetical protein